jgi:SPP1 family holin
MKATKSTIARTVVLIVALINQVLTMSGYNPLPWSETEVYEGITLILTVASSLYAWWKNNSFTKAAITADEYMKELKAKEQAED